MLCYISPRHCICKQYQGLSNNLHNINIMNNILLCLDTSDAEQICYVRLTNNKNCLRNGEEE